MAKQRVSLEALAKQGTEPEPAVVPAGQPVAAGQAGEVVEFRLGQPEPGRGARKDRPHTTLYLDKKVQKVIKEIALQYDRKPHDLYIEGINLMLRHYGRPSVKDIGG